MAQPADVTSAATLIAALLEHQGLLVQTEILDSFKGFFRDAGALVYMLAGVGAVISVLLYGSFRAPRYLIIGPALFWFLVGPRAEGVEGVAWKLGSMPEMGLRGDEGGTGTIRQQILEKLNQNANLQPRPAQGFWLFASTINELTNTLVDVILKEAKDEDLLVASKVYGLELISTAHLNDSHQLFRIEQGLMLHCPRMMASAHSAAAALIKDKAGNAFGDAGPQLRDAVVRTHTQKMKEYAGATQQGTTVGTERVPTRGTGFFELIKSHSEKPQGQGSALAKQLVQDDRTPLQHITCGQAWHLVAEELWHRSTIGMSRILRTATQALQNENLVQSACSYLTDKALREGFTDPGLPENCNIQPAIALNLLNNHLAQTATYNRVYNRHWNDSAHRNPSTHVLLTSGGQGYEFRPEGSFGTVVVKGFFNSLNSLTNAVGLTKTEVIENNGMKVTRVTTLWGAVMELRQDYGMNHAMWNSTRKFEIVRLRQGLFSYALNLPYYQGLLLYLIALTYPFFALLVILPGKAIAFLNIPLAWLWVKSWDVGFAAIIVLDQVMYNLLPSANVDQRLHDGPWTNIDLLPLAISESYNFDPLGSIHHYYSVLSFVWLSVPVIAGFMTLKAKRGILSMFSDAAENTSRESGAAASQAFSLAAQDKRNTMLREMQGFARKVPIMGANTLGQGMPGVVGRTYATLAAAAKSTDMSPSDIANLKPDAAGQLGDVAKEYSTTYSSIVQSETDLQSELLAAYDPVLGRWGNLGMLHGAYTAAMDGGGGYELYDHDYNISGQLVSAHNKKLGVSLNAIATATENFLGKFGTLAGEFNSRSGTNRMGAFTDVGTSMIIANMVMLESDKANSPDRIRDLRLMFGGEAYTNEQYYTMLTNRLPGGTRIEGDPSRAVNRESDFLFAYFGNVEHQPAPGGFSRYLNTMLSTVGGDRHVEYIAGAPPQVGAGSLPAAAFAGGLNLIQGMDGRNSMFGSNFQRQVNADTSFHSRTPQLYAQSVQHDIGALTQLYGQQNIENYFSELGTPVENGQISASHLWTYSKHVYETGGMLPNDLNEQQRSLIYEKVKLDERFEPYAESNPSIVLDELIFWNQRRGQSTTGARIRSSELDRPLIHDPRQLYNITN